MQLYHHTDTTRLPWILVSGELRPGQNAVSKLPFDFLWATTNPNGDRTAAARSGPSRAAYRAGSALAVRFSLPQDGFVSWRDVPTRFPEWTPDHVARTEALARKAGEHGFHNWHCRKDALPTDGLLIETKAWAGEWTPLSDRPRVGPMVRDGKVLGMCLIIGRTVYQSLLAAGAKALNPAFPGLPTGYVIVPPADVGELEAMGCLQSVDDYRKAHGDAA